LKTQIGDLVRVCVNKDTYGKPAMLTKQVFRVVDINRDGSIYVRGGYRVRSWVRVSNG